MADDAYDDIRDLEQKYLLYQSDAFYEEHGHKSYNNFKSISYNTSVATPGYSPALRVPGSAIPMICRSRYKNVDLFHNMSSLALSSMIPLCRVVFGDALRERNRAAPESPPRRDKTFEN